MNIIQFNRTKQTLCNECVFSDLCEKYPTDGATSEKDVWFAEWERIALQRGGVRLCGGEA